MANDIDIAFRTRHPYHDHGYESLKLAALKLGVYATPDYLKQHGEPKKISELEQHLCLLHHSIGYAEWEFKTQKILVSGTIKSNSTRVLVQFARQHMGLIRVLDSYVKPEIESGELKPVLEKHWLPLDCYLIYKAGADAPRRVLALVEFIRQHKLERYLALI